MTDRSWHDIGSFGNFTPPKQPAHALICPENYCLARPDRISPLIAVPAAHLRDIARTTLDRQPDAVLLAQADAGLRLVYRQPNGWLGGTSTITVSLVEADEQTTGIALYGEADDNSSDPERERRRLERWFMAIEQAALK